MKKFLETELRGGIRLLCRAAFVVFMIVLTSSAKAGINQTNHDDCNRLMALDALRRSTSDAIPHRDKKTDNSNVQNVLKDVIVEEVDLPVPGNVAYLGLDIDADGIEDAIIRNCGSGYGRLCSLRIAYSHGGEANVTDMAPFYIARLNEKVYLIASLDGKTSPYSKTSSVAISVVTQTGVVPACEHDVHSFPK